MTPIIKICELDDCKLVVTDLTQDSDEYLPEDIQNTEVYYKQCRFKYSDTYTINIVQQNKFESSEIINTYFTEHCSYLDEQYIQLDKDGYYTIYHLILPSVDWLNANISIVKDMVKSGKTIYITDGQRIYKYTNSLKVVDSLEVAEINDENTTIARICQDQFSICKLFACYIRLCKQIFSSINLRCINKNSNVSEARFNRDFLWMTINVMRYNIEKGNFLEAQRILESINYCNGFCQQDIEITKSSGCGCGK